MARDDQSELYQASTNGCVATLNRLIKQDPFILYKTSLTRDHETPLHISAMLGHIDFSKALISRKPRLVTELDSLRRSPLHLASAEGHTEIVKVLLDANKYICLIPDQDGRIPLHLAAMRGRVHDIRELFNAKPESMYVKLDGETVLHLCVRYNHLEALKLLVALVDEKDDEFLNCRNLEGNTILHLASSLKQSENISYLLSVPKIRASANANEIQDITMEARVKIGNEAANRLTSPSLTPPVLPEAGPPPTRQTSASMFTRLAKWALLECLTLQSIEKRHDTLMLVATVMATVTFQAGITSPPGGFWARGDLDEVCNKPHVKQIYHNVSNCMDKLTGTSQLGYYATGTAYHGFMAATSNSFLASIVVIILSVSGLPFQNFIIMWILTIAMLVAVACWFMAYLNGLYLVVPKELVGFSYYESFIQSTFFFGKSFFALVGFFYSLRFLVWVCRKYVLKTPVANWLGG